MSTPDFLIKNCPGSSSSSRCPTTWNHLRTSFSDAVRHCNSCNRKVYLCLNEQDLKFYSSLKYPIAVDSPETGSALARLAEMPPEREPVQSPRTNADAETPAVPAIAEATTAAPSVWRRSTQTASETVFRKEDVENYADMPAFMRHLAQAR